ncbi:MAG TPA: TIGR03118 family protein [Rhizomicrobium sp.]|nr:TIGR03118 family protein [Rhizomicrobium sp.]
MHMRARSSSRIRNTLIAVPALLPLLAVSAAHASGFNVANLVTNSQPANAAQIADPNLVNAWGISFSPSGPFWVSDNGTGLSTLYKVDPSTNTTSIIPLVVTIPGDGSVTGQAFNGNAASFNGDAFLFTSEDGTISGWRGALGTTAETLQSGLAANVYKGTTLASVAGNDYLLAANFGTGSVDVLKGHSGEPDLTGHFTDGSLPSGYAPFNIHNLGGRLFVTYALKGSGKDEVDALGDGYVDEFDTNGNFIARIASGGALDAPWGLALAPASFGDLAGDLLVGNFGNGTIEAIDLATNTSDGLLTDRTGQTLVIDGLWALTPGNDGSAGSSKAIYFSAGPNGESNGLFGVIEGVPEPATWIEMLIGIAGAGALYRRRHWIPRKLRTA